MHVGGQRFQLMKLLCLVTIVLSKDTCDSSTFPPEPSGGGKWIMYVLVDYQKK